MSYILIQPPRCWPNENGQSMEEAIGKIVGLTKFREVTTTWGYERPTTEFYGRLDGQEVRIGDNLFLDIPVEYTAHLCFTGRPTKKKKRLILKLISRLKSAGFYAEEWPNESLNT